MGAPGDRLRTLASRFSSRDTIERIVDPILADLRLEYHDARCKGARWRAGWILLSGYAAFWRAMTLNVVHRSGPRFALRIAAAMIASAAIPAVAWLAATLVWHGHFEGFFLMVLVGGALIAALLIRRRSLEAHSRFQPDPFHGQDLGTLNFARVRVAGLGGVGLLLAALVVALQYPLTTASVVCGIVGGGIYALVLIRQRRRA
jgi:hypothetical protein